ncbi:ABC transporter ATP-binding protein [bacterium]|nr:ABC transporter ATP-binding protein [bacterium]
MSAILQVESVKQSFRTGFWMTHVEVLHGVSLEVPKGCIFGFLGANGAGKTTLIQLIVGLRQPTSGTVRIGGYDAVSPMAKAKIGYLPERPYFHDHLTGEGLLKYFGTLSGMTSSQIQARTPKVLNEVGMSHARKLELRKYSKGMLQRIGIAQALLHDPEFLVLDEPMSGLDPMGRKEMRELILRLASEGRTIFFSSHVIPDVEAICEQVAVIQKGRLIGCGPIGKFLSDGPIQTEIAFTGLELSAAKKISELENIRAIPEGGVRGIVSSQKETTAVLKKLLAEEAKVLWVTPIRPSLEDLFHKESKT